VCYRRSLQVGLNKAVQWLAAGTGVQVVIIIKIYERRQGNEALVALRYERGAAANPTYAVSFGHRALAAVSRNQINNLGGAQVTGVGHGGIPCNGAALAPYLFRLPTAALSIGIAPAHAANVPAAAHLTIDLFLLQQRILREYPILLYFI